MATDTELLREKIKYKMDVAKFFAGFITISTGLAFNKLVDCSLNPKPAIYIPYVIGIFLIVAALGFSIVTMYAYDRLLMPPKFWRKDPAENLDQILHDEMIKAWVRLFRPAVYAFFSSLLCFLIPVLQNLYLIIGVWLVPFLIMLIYEKYSQIGRDVHG